MDCISWHVSFLLLRFNEAIDTGRGKSVRCAARSDMTNVVVPTVCAGAKLTLAPGVLKPSFHTSETVPALLLGAIVTVAM